MPDIAGIATDLASVVGVVALVYAARTLTELKRQRDRQFEAMFVQRYWALMDGLSVEATRGRPQDPVTPSDEKIALQYFRLTDDEMELHERGWISEPTWGIWADGIREQMGRWPFCAVWADLGATSDFERLRRFVPPATSAPVGDEVPSTSEREANP